MRKDTIKNILSEGLNLPKKSTQTLRDVEVGDSLYCYNFYTDKRWKQISNIFGTPFKKGKTYEVIDINPEDKKVALIDEQGDKHWIQYDQYEYGHWFEDDTTDMFFKLVKKTLSEGLRLSKSEKKGTSVEIDGDYPNGEWEKHIYDSNHNLIYSENSTGKWHKEEKDENGNLIVITGDNHTWNKYIYDKTHKLISQDHSHGENIKYKDSNISLYDKPDEYHIAEGLNLPKRKYNYDYDTIKNLFHEISVWFGVDRTITINKDAANRDVISCQFRIHVPDKGYLYFNLFAVLGVLEHSGNIYGDVGTDVYPNSEQTIDADWVIKSRDNAEDVFKEIDRVIEDFKNS